MFVDQQLSCPNLAISEYVMRHIVDVESGDNPFAIGVVGGQLERQPKNLEEAVATANMLESQGYNFSLGIAQVNRYNLSKFGLLPYEKAFDACANLKAGAKILADCYTSAKGDWDKAFSCYYSGNFVTGISAGYVQKIYNSMSKENPPTTVAVANPPGAIPLAVSAQVAPVQASTVQAAPVQATSLQTMQTQLVQMRAAQKQAADMQAAQMQADAEFNRLSKHVSTQASRLSMRTLPYGGAAQTAAAPVSPSTSAIIPEEAVTRPAATSEPFYVQPRPAAGGTALPAVVQPAVVQFSQPAVQSPGAQLNAPVSPEVDEALVF